MIRDTRTSKRQKRHVENRYSTRRNRRFESSRGELTREDILGMVEKALSEYSEDVGLDGTSAYLPTYDRYGAELSYQGYINLEEVTKDALVFHTVYPNALTLDKVLDVEKFKPAGYSREDIEEALEEAKSCRYDGELAESIAYGMSENGYVETLDIPFKDLFDEVTLDDNLDITLDENGKPIIQSDDDLRVVSEIAVKYLEGEFEAYNDEVSRIAEDVISDLECEMSDIILELEDAWEDASDED